MSSGTRHISLEFDPYVPWSRGILRGIESYAREVPQWSLLRHRMIPGRRVYLDDAPMRMDGILSRGELEWARKTGIPLVRFGPVTPEASYPVVDLDYREIGRLAARELIEKGYPRLALIQFEAVLTHIGKREYGFFEEAAEHGVEIHAIPTGLKDARSLLSVTACSEDVIRQIVTLEKPVGMFAQSLPEAYVLHSLLEESGLAIPDEIGLIAGGNDRELLEALQPPITSISRNSYQIGYTAALNLHRLMEGETVDPLTIVPPGGIVDRGSTRLQAVGDEVVQRARSLIRQRIDQPFKVDEIAQKLAVSGRSLRRRFQAAMRHSPVREIQLVRLETAKDLLANSRFSILEVAQRCGFAESCQLSNFFKVETGLTPSEFRVQNSTR